MSDLDEMEYSRDRFDEEKRYFERHVDGVSEAALDGLVTLYRFPELTLPSCSAERYAYGIDLLNAVNCYNNDIIALHHACLESARDDNTIALATLLGEGADVNLCNNRGFTAFEYFATYERRSNRGQQILRHFFKCVHRLVAMGLDVHPQNRRRYEYFLARDDMRQLVEQESRIDYNDELTRMTRVKLKNQITLRDVLTSEKIDLNDVLCKVKWMLKNDALYEAQFPNLWCLLRVRYRQTITRREWMPLVVDALRKLTRRRIPQNCVDAIVKGLANYDLANLLVVAFEECLRHFKSGRPARRESYRRASIHWSPRKMMPRI